MELKPLKDLVHRIPSVLLIVPYGIETQSYR